MNRSAGNSVASSVILFNKPYDVLCQFTDGNSPVVQEKSANSGESASPRRTLADYINRPGYYAAGRLDRDSEGLLVLTNDGKLQSRISHPRFKMAKTYYAQVEGELSLEALAQLSNGITLKDGLTRRAVAEQIDEPDFLWQRSPPIRQRQNIPTSWLSLTLTEGKNRQIRRMSAAVGFPTLRLIRVKVGDWSLQELGSGEWRYDIRSTEK